MLTQTFKWNGAAENNRYHLSIDEALSTLFDGSPEAGCTWSLTFWSGRTELLEIIRESTDKLTISVYTIINYSEDKELRYTSKAQCRAAAKKMIMRLASSFDD